MKTRKNGMTIRKFAMVGVLICLILCALAICILEQIEQGPKKTLTANRYEANYFSNRTVIRLRMVNEFEIEEAISDISKKYEVEEVIPLRPCEFRIIALPKDPNSPSS